MLIAKISWLERRCDSRRLERIGRSDTGCRKGNSTRRLLKPPTKREYRVVATGVVGRNVGCLCIPSAGGAHGHRRRINEIIARSTVARVEGITATNAYIVHLGAVSSICLNPCSAGIASETHLNVYAILPIQRVAKCIHIVGARRTPTAELTDAQRPV